MDIFLFESHYFLKYESNEVSDRITNLADTYRSAKTVKCGWTGYKLKTKALYNETSRTYPGQVSLNHTDKTVTLVVVALKCEQCL